MTDLSFDLANFFSGDNCVPSKESFFALKLSVGSHHRGPLRSDFANFGDFSTAEILREVAR